MTTKMVLCVGIFLIIVCDVLLIHFLFNFSNSLPSIDNRVHKAILRGANCFITAFVLILLLAFNFTVIWHLKAVTNLYESNVKNHEISGNTVQENQNRNNSSVTKTKVVMTSDCISQNDISKNQDAINASDYSNFEHTVDELIKNVNSTEGRKQQ